MRNKDGVNAGSFRTLPYQSRISFAESSDDGILYISKPEFQTVYLKMICAASNANRHYLKMQTPASLKLAR